MASEEPLAPRLSVIVAAWNAASTIETAVRSALDQGELPLEVVVADDGSTDETAALVEALAAGDPRAVLVRSPTNEGVSAARNRALDVARGEWLTFLDADDRLLPGGLAAMLRAADGGEAGAADGDVGAVVGQRISTDGERTWFPVLYEFPDIREPGRKSLATSPDLVYYAGPVGKLFHRSTTTGLRFEGRMLGDQPWVLRALLRAGNGIVVIGDVVYEWRRPHPDRYVATITSARQRSARLSAAAVRMALVAYRRFDEALAESVDAAARPLLRRTYLARLIRADLATGLHASLRAADPDLDRLFRAFGRLLTSVPADVVAGASDHVGRELLSPSLQAWDRLPWRARLTLWDLAVPAVRIDRGLAEVDNARGGGRAVRTALRLGRRLPLWLARPTLTGIVEAPRVARRALQRLRGSKRPATPAEPS